LLIAVFGFITLSAITSCGTKDVPENRFYGNWTRTFFNNITTTPDTVYLKFTDNTNFQLGTGSVFTQLGAGTYTYTANQITFTFQTATNGAPVCAGTSGTYIYSGTNGLILSTMLDTCGASTQLPRSTIIGGAWVKQ